MYGCAADFMWVRVLGYCSRDLYVGHGGKIKGSSRKSRHFSTISLKNFHLFKIAESVINFCLKKFSNQQF